MNEVHLWLVVLQTAALLILEVVLIALAGMVMYRLGFGKKKEDE